MEKIQSLVLEANKDVKRADHLIAVTYKLVTDTKLLIIAVENLHKALIKGMGALLRYDLIYKRIPDIPENMINRLQLFKETTAKRYNISSENILLIKDINEIIEKRKESSTEFIRKNKFIIASPNYRLRSLDVNKVKYYVEMTKIFINKVNHVLQPSDRRSNRF